jgi:hypothetical protein
MTREVSGYDLYKAYGDMINRRSVIGLSVAGEAWRGALPPYMVHAEHCDGAPCHCHIAYCATMGMVYR